MQDVVEGGVVSGCKHGKLDVLTGISRPLAATSVATSTADSSSLNLSRALSLWRCCMELCRAVTGSCSSFRTAARRRTMEIAFEKTRVRPGC